MKVKHYDLIILASKRFMNYYLWQNLLKKPKKHFLSKMRYMEKLSDFQI